MKDPITETMEVFKPGDKLPHGIPYISGPDEISNDVYHKSELYAEFISSTSLKHYAISPKYAKWAKSNPKSIGQEAALKGSVYHDMLASITNTGDMTGFDNNWKVFAPPINQRTGKPYGIDSQAWQGEYALQLEDADGKELCSQAEVDLASRMVNALYRNPHLTKDVELLIKHGKAEQSHFTYYQGAGFKYRTDLKTATKIADWKSTTLEHPKVDHFHKSIIKFGYHISAAMYQFFEHQITSEWKKFFWIVQEKEPPNDFTILDSENWTWKINNDGTIEPKIGALMFLKLMEQHILCTEKNEYPGYSIFIQPDWKGHRIGFPEVPGWYVKQMFDFFN